MLSTLNMRSYTQPIALTEADFEKCDVGLDGVNPYQRRNSPPTGLDPYIDERRNSSDSHSGWKFI